MSLATDLLAQYGFTLQQAREFVFANLGSPQVILTVAAQYGVTNAMLGEIAGGFTAQQVHGYFAGFGLDSSGLDAPAYDIGGAEGPLYAPRRLEPSEGPLALVGVGPFDAAPA